jgi:hypothetical protein
MSSKIKTQVVLEIEGKGLLSGGVEDFILTPARGSEYFYEGNIYEVAHAYETIGDATSPMGSMLLDLLGVIYPEPGQAQHVYGTMRRISGKSVPEGDSENPIASPTLASMGLVIGIQQERLLYLRLKLVHRGGPKVSLLAQLEAAQAKS